MNNNIEKWLTYKYENKELYKEDKEKIKEMYKKIPQYKYSDIFNKDHSFYHRRNSRKPCKQIEYIENRTLCSNALTVITKGIVKNENKIYKILIVKKDYKYKEIYCIELLREIYFHNLAYNCNENNNIIIPKIEDYGEIIDMKNEEIIYFYRMTYYESILNYNSVEDTCYRLVNNNFEIYNEEYNLLVDYYKQYKEGINFLLDICNKYNIYHNDNSQLTEDFYNMYEDFIENYSKWEKDKQEMVITEIKRVIAIAQKYNVYISNDKCVIIDFEIACRKELIKTSAAVRDIHKTMLELDTE